MGYKYKSISVVIYMLGSLQQLGISFPNVVVYLVIIYDDLH
jgi:hypothetical protein